MCWEKQTEWSSDPKAQMEGSGRQVTRKEQSLLQALMLPSDIVTCWPLGWWSLAGLCVYSRKLTYRVVSHRACVRPGTEVIQKWLS